MVNAASGLRKVRCKAKSKQSGVQCRRWAMPNGVCYMHGGKSPPPGPDHPKYTTGRYSKAIPGKLREAFEAANADPDILSRRADLALLDSRTEELLARIDTGEGIAIWPELKKAREAFRVAGRLGDAEERRAALGESVQKVMELIDVGVTDYESWEQISNHLDRRNRIADGERKRLESMRAYLRADEAVAMFDALTEAVRKYVTNPNERAAIGAEFERYVIRFLGSTGTGAITGATA